DGSPYYIEGEVHIPTDSMLVIEPGCSIIFTGHYKFCVDSNAVLKAIGTETDSIVFTAQDTVLTDTSGGHHGIRFYYTAEDCTLSYCRIEYGNAFGDYPDNCGGGIYCSNSSPTITNNTISRNSAYLGGGIFCEYSSPTITNNTISENSAVYGGGISCRWYSNPTIANNTISENSAGLGGGISCGNNSSPMIENNTISENSAYLGGGISCWWYSNPMITNNTINGNSAHFGGGIHCWCSSPTIISNTISGNRTSGWFDDGGGGIYCEDNSSPTIDNNTISGNRTWLGGGIYCDHSSPTITNNTITENRTVHGGGIYCDHSSPAIVNNTIFGNLTSYLGGGIACVDSSAPTIEGNKILENSAERGGGIACRDNSCPTIINNTITENSAGRGGGGGIYCRRHSNPTIINNAIIGNSASAPGAGISCRDNSSPTIINNTINGNSADSDGGGIYCDHSSPTIINNTVFGNWASGWLGNGGGGIYCRSSSPTIINTTIIGNSTDRSGGGIYCKDSSNIVILNTIFWLNSAGIGNEIHISASFCTLFIAYTDIDSSECYVEGDTTGTILWGDGNINFNPLFADTLFHLSSTSPCIDAGAESVYVPIWDTVIYAPDYDFDGGARPHGAGWDIGADEYGSSVIAENNIKRPQKIEISVYPNPFNSSCLITVPAGARVEIYDLRGRLVYTSPSSASLRSAPSPTGGEGKTYPLPPGEGGAKRRVRASKYIWSPNQSVPSGIYLIRAMTEDGQVAEKKVVLIR
ncbi:right-handed parallel beta-helix repeat-containing protein, partial [bacterium]|nr:right-handed parallel beta-helix repeat-containing protein [bacterium]